jgi:hypothetical protein
MFYSKIRILHHPPRHVSSTTMPIIRRPQLYNAPSGISLPIDCHATHWLKGLAHHDARSEKHKKINLLCFLYCGCFNLFCNVLVCGCVGVLVICVLVFTMFCIACTVFLYCFVYVYLFLFVLSVLV